MKRLSFLSIIIFLIFSLLTMRLGIIATVNHKEYSQAATTQQTQEVAVRATRKILYDRNMIPLTDSTSDAYAVIIGEQCTDKEKVHKLTGITLPKKGVKVIRMPSDKHIRKELLSCTGVSALTMPVRYFKDNLFCHLIGYGGYYNGSGLEKALDNSLVTEDSQKIYTIAAANNRSLWAKGYSSPTEKDLSGVKLTVDMHIQKICEQVMDEKCPKGAVIVADPTDGSILAMASRPAYSQDNPAEYFEKNSGELLNRALCAYDMGSVFKLLITAVAIENDAVSTDEVFLCDGVCKIGNVPFYCHNKEGHGNLTFEEAFSLSCNIPFYELGQRLGWETIKQYAQKVGFGKNIIDLALDEAKGVLPDRADSPQALANLSIGQGYMSGTPLQIAQLTQIIANGGLKKPLSIIDGKLTADGKTFKESQRLPSQRVFSTRTALILRRLMIKTVNEGTGTPAKSTFVTSGGKTGSAETGWQSDGGTMTHGWFTGFFPGDNPRYICVILNEDGKQGGASAGPVFKEIAEQITGLY